MCFHWFHWVVVNANCFSDCECMTASTQLFEWTLSRGGHVWGGGNIQRWRSTCFDWLRGQPRVCSMAAAWGIAALWFFCFGWWKDYLQSPTIAQRLEMHTRKSADLVLFSHIHALMPVKQKTQPMQWTNARPDMFFCQILNCLLTWLSDGRPQVPFQMTETRSRKTHNFTT